MMRAKVVNDSIDLVPILRAFDKDVRKNVFSEIVTDWKATSEIMDKYGKEGVDALEFFDKIKLVETKWTTPETGTREKPDKMYHSYYSSFNINISCPINELSEIFAVASLDWKDFEKLEHEIYDYVGDGGKFGNDVAEHFNLTSLALKGITKRSNKIVYKGMNLERARKTHD